MLIGDWIVVVESIHALLFFQKKILKHVPTLGLASIQEEICTWMITMVVYRSAYPV